MKKVIDGKRYDTATAKCLGRWESDQDYQGLYHEEEELYLTKAGNYFLYCCGGSASRYNKKVEANRWASGEQIHPISEERAQNWAKDRLDESEYELLFGIPEDIGTMQATIRIPAKLAERLIERMDAERLNRNELIIKALREYLK